MEEKPKIPRAYGQFTALFPKVGEAWNLVRDAEADASFDLKTARLMKLAIAVGAMRQGAVHSCVRKALAAGVRPEEILDVAVFSVGTLGFPSAVAVFSWMNDVLDA